MIDNFMVQMSITLSMINSVLEEDVSLIKRKTSKMVEEGVSCVLEIESLQEEYHPLYFISFDASWQFYLPNLLYLPTSRI